MKDFWDKLDISGKFFNGVIIALLLFLGSHFANKFADKMKKADLQKSLISDLSALDNNIRRDIALITLDYAFPEEDSSVVADIAEIIYNESYALNAKGFNQKQQDSFQRVSNTAVAYIILAKRIPSRAQAIQSRVFNAAFTSYEDTFIRTSQRSPSDTSKPEKNYGSALLAKNNPALVQQINAIYKTSIFIQYQGDTSDFSAFAALCQSKGWFVPPKEKIRPSIKTEKAIRYFHAEDKKASYSVRDCMSTTLKIKTENIKIEFLGKKYPNIPKGQIEVWINRPRQSKI